MYKVVFVRHGESVWNKENVFTGWVDVDLNENGMAQARKAAQLMKERGLTFDVAHTSFLKRAIRTLWIILDEMDLMWIPEYKSWRLNERHYGALTGKNKAMTAEEFGEEMVKMWRRCYAVQPPAMSTDQENPADHRRYTEAQECPIPQTESLKDTLKRAVSYWETDIAPQVVRGKRVLVAAHGNTLRAYMMHFDQLSEEQVMDLNIPVGEPFVYEFDETMKPIRHYYLDDPEKIAAGIKATAEQAKVRHQ